MSHQRLITPSLTDRRLFARVGHVVNPLSAPPVTVTADGIQFKPKAVLSSHFRTPSHSQTNMAMMGLGMGTGPSAEGLCSVSMRNGEATSWSDRYHDNAAHAGTLSDTGTIHDRSEIQSIVNDQIVWNMLDSNTVSEDFQNYLALGGSIEASLVQDRSSNSVAPFTESFNHGLSGPPEALIFLSITNGTAAPSNIPSGCLSLGFWAGGNHFVNSIDCRDAVTPTQSKTYASDTEIFYGQSASTLREVVRVDSVDDTQVHLEWTTHDSNQRDFWLLCLRGCTAHVGKFNPLASLGEQEESIPGMLRPRCMIILGGYINLMSTLGVIQNHGMFWTTFNDGTYSRGGGVSDEDGVATTNTGRWQTDQAIEHRSLTGTSRARATVKFGREKAIFDLSVMASSSWGEFGYLALGDPQV